MTDRRPSLGIVTTLAVVLCACEPGATTPQVETLVVVPPAGLAAGVGGKMRFTALAYGEGGEELSVDGVAWSVEHPEIAAVDARGAAAGLAAGTTTVRARLGERTATADLEVYFPEPVGRYEPGESYFGRGRYVEYIPGELPVILSAPHGGRLTPSEIADRVDGVLVRDVNTLELTLAIRDALIDLTGLAPHVVLSHLDRSKLDPNREVEEAAQGDPFAEWAWAEYHAFIEVARGPVDARGGGMYFDIHGHGHPKDRLELGYLLTSTHLDRADELLNSLGVVQLTSIREIGRDSPLPFSRILRGAPSLGGLLEAQGLPVVPGPSVPSPGADPYFSGGYSTLRHGSNRDTELVSGIQIEHHFTGIRDSEASRRAYATILAGAIRDFMLQHFGYLEPN